MDIVTAILTAIKDTPTSNLLILAGILFLLLSVIGKIGEKLVIDPNRQKYAGILGGVLLTIGLALAFVPDHHQTPTPSLPPTENCEQLNLEIRNTEQELMDTTRGRDGIVSEIDRLQHFMDTDPHAPAAYQSQEDALRNAETRMRELAQKKDDLINRRNQACRQQR